MTVPVRLRECIASVLKCDPKTLSSDSGLDTISGWDSLAHTQIIVAVEREFDIAFDFDEIDDIVNVARINSSLERKGVSLGSV